MIAVMGDASACVMYGHGITVGAPTVEQATVLAINLNTLLAVTVELARLGAAPPALDERDVAELPDLGTAFNDQLVWRSLVSELEAGTLRPVP
jgi:ribulose-5-phosphate 4-epimerase/fuculose-1-phosphate aldolase